MIFRIFIIQNVYYIIYFIRFHFLPFKEKGFGLKSYFFLKGCI